MNTCEACKCNKVCNHDKFGFENCGNHISKDAVEVVRCKDCRYVSCIQPNGTIHCGRESVLGEGTVFRKADDFCSYGKRKEDV